MKYKFLNKLTKEELLELQSDLTSLNLKKSIEEQLSKINTKITDFNEVIASMDYETFTKEHNDLNLDCDSITVFKKAIELLQSEPEKSIDDKLKSHKLSEIYQERYYDPSRIRLRRILELSENNLVNSQIKNKPYRDVTIKDICSAPSVQIVKFAHGIRGIGPLKEYILKQDINLIKNVVNDVKVKKLNK